MKAYHERMEWSKSSKRVGTEACVSEKFYQFLCLHLTHNHGYRQEIEVQSVVVSLSSVAHASHKARFRCRNSCWNLYMLHVLTRVAQCF